MTDRIDVVNYFTGWTGLFGVAGWVLHRTVFLSKWFVTAESTVPGASTALRFDRLSKSQAPAVFQRLIEWLGSNRSAHEFDPALEATVSRASRS